MGPPVKEKLRTVMIGFPVRMNSLRSLAPSHWKTVQPSVPADL